MRARHAPTALLALGLVLSACRCEDPVPVWPGGPVEGHLEVVEAAWPEGGAEATATGSDLSLPPREADLGWWVDLAVDGAGRPHLAYTDAYNGELHHAVREGSGWRVEGVDTHGAVGKYAAVAVDDAGRPHVVYYNQDRQRLYYATRVGAERVNPRDRRRPFQGHPDWLFEIVDEGEELGMAATLTLDPDGTAHAFYYAPDERLLHAWRPPTAPGEHARWRRRVVDPHAGGSHSVILGHARASDGTRHLSYSHWTVMNSELRHATLAPGGDAWEAETVTAQDNAGWKSGLFLDEAGRPTIVFLALKARQLRLARPGAGGWEVTPLVDSANSMEVARAPDGGLVVAYEHLPGQGLANASVRYLSRPGLEGDLAQGWTRHELPGTTVHGYLALDVAPDGTPVLAWYDGGIRGVRVWTAAPGS